jgi:hypothetical protein
MSAKCLCPRNQRQRSGAVEAIIQPGPDDLEAVGEICRSYLPSFEGIGQERVIAAAVMLAQLPTAKFWEPLPLRGALRSRSNMTTRVC